MSTLPSVPACAAIYVRVSTDRQEEDGTSLATQEQRCWAYCESKGWMVAGVYSDTYSGASLYDR